MKLSKRLLALLLAFMLALGLCAAAVAQEEPEEPNPAMPVITVQPRGGRVKLGRSLNLRVQAHIPNGDEIGYRWFRDERQLGTGKASITGTANQFSAGDYRVEVCNRANPELCVTSETVRVEVYQTVFQKLRLDVFLEIVLAIILAPVLLPVALLLMPFAMGGVVGINTLMAPFYWFVNLFRK